MKRAIVMAGGMGTRLRPYTTVLPKPLMPVGDRPILDLIVRQLHDQGFERITILTGYLAELIEAFFRDGSAYGIPIDYVREHEPLGTVGGLALLDSLDEPFLLMNGDVLSDLHYGEMLTRHRVSGAAATIATQTQTVEVSLGVLDFDGSDPDRLTGFREKPSFEFTASMGVYCFDPSVLAHIPRDVALDFPTLVLRLVAAGHEVRAWRSSDFWLDIGRHDDYERAQEEFRVLRDRLLPGEAPAEPAQPSLRAVA